MLKTMFPTYVTKWFSAIAKKVNETFNGSAQEPTYLFKQMLTESLSLDLKWASLSSKGTIIAADIVAMDSSLPLKKRDSLEKANGNIPKVGLKLALTEKQLSDIQILVAKGGNEAEVVKKLFADTKKCMTAVEEIIEFMFLTALSTGNVLMPSGNSGKGVRASLGLSDSNKFGVKYKWDQANATPNDDIENVISAASNKGYTITHLMMDRATFTLWRRSGQMRGLYAASIGYTAEDKPIPTKKVALELINEEFGVQVQTVDRSIRLEADGQQTIHKPWEAGMVTFLTSLNVGELQYGQLAEKNIPVEGVVYENPTSYTLLSKYHKNDPLREYTSAQALVIPVLQELDGFFLMDTNEAQELDEDAEAADSGDTKVTIWDAEFVKATVISELNSMEITTPSNIGDETLIAKINQLSDADEATLRAALEA